MEKEKLGTDLIASGSISQFRTNRRRICFLYCDSVASRSIKREVRAGQVVHFGIRAQIKIR